MRASSAKIVDRSGWGYWLGAWAFNAALLAVTWWAAADRVPLDSVLAKVPNIWEYTVGNWWSAMQALAIAVLGALGAWEARDAGQRAWWAFAAIGVLGMILCLDEMGSVHEHWTNYWMMIKDEYKHIALLPILVAAGLLFLVSLGAFFRDRKLYGPMWLGLLGCFGFLGLLDQLELKVEALTAPTATMATYAMLEEGLEMVAFTCIAALLWGQRHRQRRLGRWTTRRWDAAGLSIAASLALIAPILAGLRWVFGSSPAIDLVKRGDPGAACAIALLGLGAWVVFLRRRHGRFTGLGTWVLGITLMLACLESSCHLRHLLMPMHGGERRIDGVFFFTTLGVLLAVAMTQAWRVKASVWAVPAVLSLVSVGVWAVYKTPISLLWSAWGAAMLMGWAMMLPDTAAADELSQRSPAMTPSQTPRTPADLATRPA